MVSNRIVRQLSIKLSELAYDYLSGEEDDISPYNHAVVDLNSPEKHGYKKEQSPDKIMQP